MLWILEIIYMVVPTLKIFQCNFDSKKRHYWILSKQCHCVLIEISTLYVSYTHQIVVHIRNVNYLQTALSPTLDIRLLATFPWKSDHRHSASNLKLFTKIV